MKTNRLSLRAGICLSAGALWWAALAESAAADDATNRPAPATVVEVEGTVEAQPKGNAAWNAARTNQALNFGDRLRTMESSRATVRSGENSLLRLDRMSLFEVQPPRNAQNWSHIEKLLHGRLNSVHRGQPSELELQTPDTTVAVQGTDFSLSVDDDNVTTLTMIDGRATLTSTQGSIELRSGEQGIAEPGRSPRKTAVLNAINTVQWSLYYPGVLDPDELKLAAPPGGAEAESIAAYRAGDLLEALARWPAGTTGNASQRLYQAALALASGDVTNCEALLAAQPTGKSMAAALRYVIAAVTDREIETAAGAGSPSQLLGLSYYQQSRHQLAEALQSATAAVAASTNFAFGWERVAELEFSFGRVPAAKAALERSLRLAPRNAQAHALEGFLLAAQNRITAAVAEFNTAINLDGALANAWLGRGLCRIKQGHTHAGDEDLLTAAALEPNRSFLRSYLGKAFADSGDDAHADNELRLARLLDPNDPTAWLYSALLEQEQNQINPAISDLQNAQTNNDNRSVFRSGLLLDQDRAVASANLASVYRDAGMTDVSVREAARAVTDDYANDSAHLFLADSYYSLLDPTQFNLRYDTAWFNELLLANILAPIGGGRLSQQVSQQDYSKLFEADGLGLASSTDLRTDGMSHQTASQFGTYGNTAYGVDLNYYHNDGIRVNNTLDNLNLDATIKQQVSPQDTALFLVQYENYHSGDNFQYYYQTNARPFYKFDEQQQPELVGAWHHEWAPGIHTLLLLGRLVDDQQFSDQAAPQLVFAERGSGAIYGASTVPFDASYGEKFEIYSAELNQICQWERVTLSAGGRYQSGEFHTQDQFANANPSYASLFPTTPYSGDTTGLFQRVTAYSYLTVEPLAHLWLTGGVAADQETFPYSFRNPPVTAEEDTRSQLGPKAALVWSPIPEATVRGIYTRSLGGASIDESYRLEPTELAGFPQAFRSLISESIVGSQSAPTFETLGCALDLKLGTHTYLGFQVERLASEANQGQGDFVLADGGVPAVVSSTPEQLDYVEHDGSVSLNQLFGEYFVLGAAYKINQSDLHQMYPGIPTAVIGPIQERATLQEINTYLLFNHPSGFYSKLEVNWYGQHNTGWTPVEPNVSFAQENIFAGYRFLHRRAEAQLGILNLSGGGYDLNPLTVYQELPRKRVLEASLNFTF
jgi:Tfp pilus assembly protein PilF